MALQVLKSKTSLYGSTIEYGPSDNHDGEFFVRLRWSNSVGGYDPISSSQIPVWAFPELIASAVEWGAISRDDAISMIKDLSKLL